MIVHISFEALVLGATALAGFVAFLEWRDRTLHGRALCPAPVEADDDKLPRPTRCR